jgi:hypothetical protein
MWGRHDAHGTSMKQRRCSHTEPEMVLAQGLGHAAGPSSRREIEFRPGGKAPLAGTMDEVSSPGTWFRFGRTMFRLFHLILLNPSWGGH